MAKKPKIDELSADQRAEAKQWFEKHCAELPEPIRIIIEQHGFFAEALEGTRRELSQVITQLRRAMGITPSSERSSDDPIGAIKQADEANPDGLDNKNKKNKEEHAQEKPSEKSERLCKWHRYLANRHSRKAKKQKANEAKMRVEDIELSPEELAEIKREDEQFSKNIRFGDPDPKFESIQQTFMTGTQAKIEEDFESVKAPATGDAKVIDRVIDTRERYDFDILIRRIEINVEKKIIEDGSGERRVVAGSTKHLGPPRYDVTWNFLANMTLLIAQYAMPMNRLAGVLSNNLKRFTAAYLSRLFNYVAHRFVPIYMALIDALADSSVLTGDDTSIRVLEVQKAFKKSIPRDEQPWKYYRTIEEANESFKDPEKKQSLGVILGRELGYEFMRRASKSKNEAKTSLHTTIVSGRSNADDPRSLIVIYRSHLGGLGNLLEILLKKRKPHFSELVVQSDLSTANLVSDPELCEKFKIRYAGCASHARRPFAIYEQDDPDMCAAMLHYFKGLFIYERCLDDFGRNEQKVRLIRGIDSRKMWETIKEHAQIMQERWSPETKLGKATNYIIKNYNKLTAYIDDPRIELSNNFSERLLRLEKLIQASSLFRKSMEGRFALDIMRSVLQTAVAAKVPLLDYLLFVLRALPENIAEKPENFTPLAYAQTRR